MQGIVVLILLPAVVLGASSGPNSFLHTILGCDKDWGPAGEFEDEAYRNSMKNSPYLVTYRDGYANEIATTCPKLIFDFEAGEYTYSFKQADGTAVSHTGGLSYSDGKIRMSNMYKGHLGAECTWFLWAWIFGEDCNSDLDPVYFDTNGFLMKACYNEFFSATQTAYYLTRESATDANICSDQSCAA